MNSSTYPAAQHVMVLYTGGTIGMQASANGLAPASGFEARMRDYLHSQPELVVPQWRFREMSPLIDSANMTPAYWQQLREAVVDAVDVQGCDSVLILHGTDTLAYSAAAMSFQLLGLHARVCFTGSMLPAGAPDSDAWDNLAGALAVFADGVQSGVQLFFAGKLLPGVHASKLRSEAFDAFAALPRHREGEQAAELPAVLSYCQPRTEVNLAVLPVYPGVQAAHVQALLDTGVKGLLLECYGSGTGPSDDEALLDVLREAGERGVLVAAISQCPEGSVVFDTYAAGSRLRDTGLVSAGGMTREAALGKLFALLGAGLDLATARHWFGLDMCGERA